MFRLGLLFLVGGGEIRNVPALSVGSARATGRSASDTHKTARTAPHTTKGTTTKRDGADLASEASCICAFLRNVVVILKCCS